MGKVIVVGIGPGGYEDMTIRADEALQACDAIVGYPVYVDLMRDRYPGKELHSTPMTRETERCQLVLELARSGMTMVIVTHEMRFAEAVADRVVFLENGLVEEESVPAQFFHQPHTQRAQQFLASFCYDSVRDGKNMQNTKEAN